jgi:hypothetical protein
MSAGDHNISVKIALNRSGFGCIQWIGTRHSH